MKSLGRPRLFCSPVCRKAAYEDCGSHLDISVKVHILEKIVPEEWARHLAAVDYGREEKEARL